MVILNGIYQPQLSAAVTDLKFDGECLEIPKNIRVLVPLHLLFLASQSCNSVLNIIMAEGSYITIIEEHASLGEIPYTSNFTSHITAEANSEMVYYKLQLANIERANQQTTREIKQAKNSKITVHFINQGAKTARNRLHIKLTGENASYNMQGVNLLHNHQNMHDQIRVEHLASSCTSTILAKSIVDDQAVNDFDCRVVVHRGATKTATHVTSKNLLLSESATVSAAPALEVYVDDVVCTHGATVGQLDHDALFYLRSRGIAEDQAIKILISAFVQEIAEQFTKYDRFKNAIGLAYDQ